MLGVAFSSGCMSYNVATGRNEFIAISTPEEISMGRAAHEDILKRYKLSQDPGKVERVDLIGRRLAQISDRQDYRYHFYLVEKDEMNAFTTPGGNIYFFTGLYDKLSTDDEIASVLAHEMGHCAARHTVKKFQAAMGYNLIGTIIFEGLMKGNRARDVAALGTGAVMNLVFSAYSRNDEYEADRLGVKYMYLAGYDLHAIIATFTILKQAAKGAHPPLILSTHPYLDDRIKEVEKEIEAVKSKYGDGVS